ncbi:MAG: tRNA (adenosine(37)-N6)-dimethylallyltransferase MiaA, partial [Pseudomonadota bacterium]
MKNMPMTPDQAIGAMDDTTPILIAGCTASGKSDFALRIAERHGGTIINADALQVYANWSVLTARPPAQDLARAPHRLYGHVPGDVAYTVGDWLRDVRPMLQDDRPIIVGGTGLFFRALTEGLADIPPTPPAIRAKADTHTLSDLIADLPATTLDRLDVNNRVRVQRAWEVLQATGRPLHDWQKATPPPALPLSQCQAFVLQGDTDWLNHRIVRRFDHMMAHGALDEARANLAHWTPTALSARAIGAAELMAYVQGQMDLDTARETAIIATRQYAKRQRTWFRKRMAHWQNVTPEG